MKQPRAMTEVIWLERVPKGERPQVFKRKGPVIPGDAIFCEVRVYGVKFAITCIAAGVSDVPPEGFELALRATVAALAEAVGLPKEEGVQVLSETDIN